MAAAFDLNQNPFFLLSLSIRARREEVVEAHEEALADGRADEVVLARAQQAVLTPRTRIEAELSWFPSTRPSLARETLSKLERNSLADARGTLERLQGLDKANLAAHLCAHLDGETKYVNALLEAYEDFSADYVQQILRGLRSVSGFPIPDQQQVSIALDSLRVKHAKAAVACLAAAKRPGEALTEIVEAFLDCGDDNVEHLLDWIVREYKAWSQPSLDKIQERIEAAIAKYRAGGDLVPVEQLVNNLAEWDSVSQPVQLHDQSKGHEEPRSKELYEIVRDFCFWLANENDQYEEALTISRALLETFPELPAVSKQLSKDVDALESLVEEAKSIELMGPLVRAIEAAQTETTTFDHDVEASGFGPKSLGHAKNLYDAFADVAAKTAGTDHADEPWMVVRGLAIDLNNKHKSPEGAVAILEGLIAHKDTTSSKAVIERLENDRRTLRRHLKWEALKRSDNFQERTALVTYLLDGADADERAALLQIKTALVQQRTATVMKRVFWGMALAGFFGFLAYDANKKPSYSPDPSPTKALTPSTPRTSTSTPSSPTTSLDPLDFYEPSPRTSTSTPSSPTAVEQIPPPGTDRVLNMSEVRYCIFQGERLDILRGLVSSNAEIDRFNRLVSDLNSRCSSFRYRRGVLKSIQAEVSGIRQHLRQGAQRLLSSWRASSFSSTMDDHLIDVSTVSGAILVQNRLKELGYYAGQVDGIWGTASQTALRNFKLSESELRYDDRWDLVTQKALMGR